MSYWEIAGFISGIAGVWLTLKENAWCFPVGLINVVISLFIFYNQKLYADSVQQLVYITLLTYGWHKWLHGTGKVEKFRVSRLSSKELMISAFCWLTTSLVLGSLLSNYTDASTPWPDSIATALSFIAQWMVAQKKLENWLLWITVNLAYIAIYIYKDLFLYAILFAVYLALAIWGFITWQREFKSYAT